MRKRRREIDRGKVEKLKERMRRERERERTPRREKKCYKGHRTLSLP